VRTGVEGSIEDIAERDVGLIVSRGDEGISMDERTGGTRGTAGRDGRDGTMRIYILIEV
jgi:hypothetical protein